MPWPSLAAPGGWHNMVNRVKNPSRTAVTQATGRDLHVHREQKLVASSSWLTELGHFLPDIGIYEHSAMWGPVLVLTCASLLTTEGGMKMSGNSVTDGE